MKNDESYWWNSTIAIEQMRFGDSKMNNFMEFNQNESSKWPNNDLTRTTNKHKSKVKIVFTENILLAI